MRRPLKTIPPVIIIHMRISSVPPKSDISEKAADLIGSVFDYIVATSSSDSFWRIGFAGIFLIILLSVGIGFIIKSFGVAVEALAKLIENAKKNGFSFSNNEERKTKIRKRQQFCAVLDADLSYIAKAENWNDQYFTDLEAEVEAEGQYFTSVFNRWRNKRFSGLRRVASLIKAIDASLEKVVLLVGEPGSGKSVALRHLAKQMAERGKKSNDLNELIPLYLNLRELEGSFSPVTADNIKNFVLENIRRGDADTTAYVKENWAENQDHGRWFFLFDSFDEIPDVLHAPTGSVAVRQYSDAIRQFLDGMGACRGVLASREYKGPNALPWHKFRILPLNTDLQHKLVSNSFLNRSQIEKVNLYLAAERSTLGNNPLFLTLLCRFAKDEGDVPTNDHQLVTSHIQRLANREPEYTLRKFGLSPDELIQGAEKIAIAFAKDPRIGLAPKVDEIFSAINDEDFSLDELNRLIGALVDVKIGRNDVPTARPGDRRFTFSHRRYQESLFANYLAFNPTFIPPAQLLQNLEWREYAVTLLQSQEIQGIAPIIECAIEILSTNHNRQRRLQHVITEIDDLGYFDWRNEPETNLLEILQEGLKRRLNDVPESLRNAVGGYLIPRWRSGDHIDRFMVLKLGGLMAQETFRDFLGGELQFGSIEAEEIAFRQCAYLLDTSEDLNILVRRKLAEESLCANTLLSRLRLEALAAQLPSTIEANYVVSRCNALRPIYSYLNLFSMLIVWPNAAINKILKMLGLKSRFTDKMDRLLPSVQYDGGWQWVFSLLILPFFWLMNFGLVFIKTNNLIIIDTANSRLVQSLNNEFFHACLFVDIFLLAVLVILYLTRYAGREAGFPFIFNRLMSVRVDRKDVIASLPMPLAFVIVFGMPYLLGHAAHYALLSLGVHIKIRSIYFELGFPIFIGLLAILAVVASAVFARNLIRARARLDKLIQSGLRGLEIFVSSDSELEMGIWLERKPILMGANEVEARSISSVALSQFDHRGVVEVVVPATGLVRSRRYPSRVTQKVGSKALEIWHAEV